VNEHASTEPPSHPDLEPEQAYIYSLGAIPLAG